MTPTGEPIPVEVKAHQGRESNLEVEVTQQKLKPKVATTDHREPNTQKRQQELN